MIESFEVLELREKKFLTAGTEFLDYVEMRYVNRTFVCVHCKTERIDQMMKLCGMTNAESKI